MGGARGAEAVQVDLRNKLLNKLHLCVHHCVYLSAITNCIYLKFTKS